MTVRTELLNCLLLILAGSITYFPQQSFGSPRGTSGGGKLNLEPAEVIAYAGDNVTFTCSLPSNATFQWEFNDNVDPYKITTGFTIINGTSAIMYWSSLTLVGVKRIMSGEVSCKVEGSKQPAIAFLIVNGVEIGGTCRTQDCITDKATCQRGVCACPKNYVLLLLTESGYQVCRKMIYKLYDPCEFSEQCVHLVDSKSVCDASGICVCASWASDMDGKCVAKNEITYNRNQEMYRVGLIAITCVIIIVVAVSLWITLRRSCQEQNTDGQTRSITQNPDENLPDAVIIDASNDKPPSYSEILETGEIVTSPPNFIEALKNSVTSKRLMRQVSAPAGQLLSGNANQSVHTNAKAGSVSPVFTVEG